MQFQANFLFRLHHICSKKEYLELNIEKLKAGVAVYINRQNKENGKQEEPSKTSEDIAISIEDDPQTTTNVDQTTKTT